MAKRKQSSDEQLLANYASGKLVSAGLSKAELKKFRDAARATFVKDRRVNIRLSSPVLLDIQARAAEEGIPYQTLIASVLHKYVTGRLAERGATRAKQAPSRATKRRTTSIS